MVGMDSASLKTETERYNILILVFYNYWVSYKNAWLLSHLIQVCSQMASLERTSLTILSKEYDLPLLSSLLPASFFTAILLDIALTCLLTHFVSSTKMSTPWGQGLVRLAHNGSPVLRRVPSTWKRSIRICWMNKWSGRNLEWEMGETTGESNTWFHLDELRELLKLNILLLGRTKTKTYTFSVHSALIFIL